MSAMMREILTARLRSAAMHLGSLLSDVVFIGGAVIPLLMTDRGARDVRSTDDIDVVISLTSKVEWYALQDQLKTLGFKPGGRSAPLCRFVKDDLILDIVPTEESVLGFSNRWYRGAMTTAVVQQIGKYQLRVITAPYFVATKLEAYASRGNDDMMFSHDIEDIVALIDGRPELEAEISKESQSLQTYIAASMQRLVAHKDFNEAVEGALAGDTKRAMRAIGWIKKLAQSNRSTG